MPSFMTINTTLAAVDVAGTAVFAVSGAGVGIRYRLDVFGVCVLAVVAGNAGGVIRDLLIGAVPVVAVTRWEYVTVSLIAGLVTFRWHPRIDRIRVPILLFDAAGLALFAVGGTQKALSFGLNPLMAPLLGMLTGIGGGMIRDVLISEIPTVLRSDFYAVAALAGSAVVVAGHLLQLPPSLTTSCGALLCFLIRLAAVRRGWSLPRAGVDDSA